MEMSYKKFNSISFLLVEIVTFSISFFIIFLMIV